MRYAVYVLCKCENATKRYGCWEKQSNSVHISQSVINKYKITRMITILYFCTPLFFYITVPLFNFVRNVATKSAQNNTVAIQNCPVCRVRLCSLKCVSLHLYKRLHFAKVKYLNGAETRTLGAVDQKYL